MISKYKSVLIWVQTQSVLIWVQTVCKGYQQMTKVDASKERVILAHRIRISEIENLILPMLSCEGYIHWSSSDVIVML